MTLKENQRLVCAGQMPLRAPDGTQLAAVPVFKIVSAEDVGADSVAELSPNERLTLIGTEQSKAAAEERYNALMDVELDVLRHLVRLAADRKLYPNSAPCLPFKKYEHWSKMLDEIGRMIGGYMKSVKQ